MDSVQSQTDAASDALLSFASEAADETPAQPVHELFDLAGANESNVLIENGSSVRSYRWLLLPSTLAVGVMLGWVSGYFTASATSQIIIGPPPQAIAFGNQHRAPEELFGEQASVARATTRTRQHTTRLSNAT